jgi:tetratricopeptide (TPR) repeat protein
MLRFVSCRVPRRGFLLSGAVVLLLGLAASAAPQTPPSSPARKLSTADLAAIERRLSDAIKSNPDSLTAHHELATFYLQQGKLAAAIPHLERAQAIDPTHYPSGYDLAVALLETGKVDRARAQVTRMLGAKDAAELHNLLGDVEERAGNLTKAAEEYQRAARMEPTEDHLFDWGNNLLRLQAYDPAIEVFAASVARFPKAARLHIGLGIAQYSRGQYADAVKSFCQAADLAPADPRPYQFLGEMYGVAPDLGTEVTERMARFAKAQPRNPAANFYYAMSLWKGQSADASGPDLKRVETLLRRAVALDPKLTKGFLQLGILLSEQQRYADAIPELRRAIQLEPELATAHYRLAQAYQRTKQPELAAEEMRLFEKLKGRSR